MIKDALAFAFLAAVWIVAYAVISPADAATLECAVSEYAWRTVTMVFFGTVILCNLVFILTLAMCRAAKTDDGESHP